MRKDHDPQPVELMPLVWCSPHDLGVWQVTFTAAEIAGRFECIGVSIEPLAGFVKWGTHTPTGQPLAIVRRDGVIDALHVVGADGGDLPDPAPAVLTAKAVRYLPFGDMLVRAKRARAESSGSEARVYRQAGMEGPAARRDAVAGALSAPRAPQGRPARYTDADVQSAADIYSRAHKAGIPTPTKAVAEAMGIPRSSAEKLVWRARRSGHLGQTEKFKAGGLPGQDVGGST